MSERDVVPLTGWRLWLVVAILLPVAAYLWVEDRIRALRGAALYAVEHSAPASPTESIPSSTEAETNE